LAAVAAYSHNNTAMKLPPGSDKTSGSNPAPKAPIRAATRPALSTKLIMAVSLAA
jgi:hypothetical protein